MSAENINQKPEPIYQVRFEQTWSWHDATEDAFHTFMPERRRIVYAASVTAVAPAEPLVEALRQIRYCCAAPAGPTMRRIAIDALDAYAAAVAPSDAKGKADAANAGGRRVTYVPLRGKKGVMQVTAWGPVDMVLPPHRRIIDDVLLFATSVAEAKDAARFRWLNEDHDDAEVREKARDLAGRLGTSSYYAITRDIDAAMAAAPSSEKGGDA